MKYSSGVSNFLDEISSLCHSIVFLYCTVHLRSLLISLLFFTSNHSIEYILPFLFSLSLLFCSQLFVRPPQTPTLLLAFLFWGVILVTTSCTMSWSPSIDIQAICLPDLIPWIYLPLVLYNHKGFVLWFMSYLNDLVVFSTILNLSLDFAIGSSWSEPQSASGLVFAVEGRHTDTIITEN